MERRMLGKRKFIGVKNLRLNPPLAPSEKHTRSCRNIKHGLRHEQIAHSPSRSSITPIHRRKSMAARMIIASTRPCQVHAVMGIFFISELMLISQSQIAQEMKLRDAQTDSFEAPKCGLGSLVLIPTFLRSGTSKLGRFRLFGLGLLGLVKAQLGLDSQILHDVALSLGRIFAHVKREHLVDSFVLRHQDRL